MRQPSSTLATLPEPARQVPVVLDCDVCVIGGSCTGVFAAVRAARLGARVALVEKQNCFGGTATAGLVNVWHTLDDLTGDRRIISGLTAEVLERLRKREAVTDLPYARGAHFLNSEELKIELDELVLEHDITPLLHTLYVAPVVEEGRLAGIIVENKDGRQAIRARQFIDASGEGDLARDLGLPGQDDVPPSPALKELAGGGTPISPSPDPGEGAGGGTLLQPPTTCAKILGLNTLGDWDWQAAVREHGAEFGLEPDWGWGNSCPGAPDLQMRADNHLFGVDGSRATDLTRAEIEGRRKVRALLDIIRTYGPPSAAVVLADLAAAVGIRETARLAASYRLTGEDILYGRRFDDAIANGTYPVDIHHANGPGLTFYYLDGQKRVVRERGHEGELSRWREETSENPSCYQIPLRCL
ncbi:MAG: FAD-dependent oxidoreductase, partial [candidate division WS1 bacterium]|nr:FAD-dependent oxidoreductase [candidate division WS1 bacterium]